MVLNFAAGPAKLPDEVSVDIWNFVSNLELKKEKKNIKGIISHLII